MLAPGEYLTTTPGDRSGANPPTDQQPPARPEPARAAEQPEPSSFLLTLLRALGAIHT